MLCFECVLDKQANLENLSHFLSQFSEDAVVCVEEQDRCLYYIHSDQPLDHLPFFSSVKPIFEVNWTDQMQSFSPFLKKGDYIEVSLAGFGCQDQFYLMSGPAFGDGSHVTTHLMLELMSSVNFSNQSVLDIGSGSGILTFAAKSFGCRQAIGIEIDMHALQVSKKSQALNHYQDIYFYHSDELIEADAKVLLINMIFTEQQNALKDFCFEEIEIIISSGILFSEDKKYKTFWKEKGFEYIDSIIKDEWVGYLFHKEK